MTCTTVHSKGYIILLSLFCVNKFKKAIAIFFVSFNYGRKHHFPRNKIEFIWFILFKSSDKHSYSTFNYNTKVIIQIVKWEYFFNKKFIEDTILGRN